MDNTPILFVIPVVILLMAAIVFGWLTPPAAPKKVTVDDYECVAVAQETTLFQQKTVWECAPKKKGEKHE